jgi:hypothetical protein
VFAAIRHVVGAKGERVMKRIEFGMGSLSNKAGVVKREQRGHGRLGAARGVGLLALTLMAMLAAIMPSRQVTDVDFNNDGVVGDVADARDFERVLAGEECESCDTIDVNRDGVYPADDDIAAFFAALGKQSGHDMIGVGTGPNGFSPVIVGEGAWQMWVAPAPIGSDDNPGTREKPKATPQAILNELRKDSHGVIWFMEGEYEFAIRAHHEGLSYGGMSAEKPLTFAADVQAKTRPIINVPETESAGIRIPDVGYVRVQGLEFRGVEQQVAMVTLGGNVTHVLVEDCVLKGGTLGVAVQGMGGRVGTVVVRRNIIQDQRNMESHSQGIYVSEADRLVIEDNVFWNNGNRDTFCHGMYLVHDPNSYRIVRRNWIGDPGFAGVQARGGTYEVHHNVMDKCGNGIGVGHPMGLGVDANGEFYENLILNPKGPAWGIAIQNMRQTTVRDNLMFAPDGVGYFFVRENPSNGGLVKNNRGYGWSTVLFDTNTDPTQEKIEGNTIMRAVEIPRVPWAALRARGRGVWGFDNDAKQFVDRVRANDPWNQ